MDLVQINVVCLQVLEATIDRKLDLLPGQPAQFAVFPEPAHDRPANHLGGHDHLVAIAGLFEPRPDDPFRPPLGLLLWRDRIEFGCIEEVDTLFERKVHLGVTLGFRILLTESHRAEAEGADLNIRTAKRAQFHEDYPCLSIE